MDPLGIAKDIFKVIGFIYICLTLFFLGLALVKPKTKIGKLIATLVVTGVSCYFPVSTVLQSRKETATFVDSCAKAYVKTEPVNVEAGYFFAREYLQIGLSRSLYTDDFVRHLLTNKLTYFETEFDEQDWWKFKNEYGLKKEFSSPYIRISIQEKGHQSCNGFNQWVSEYPAQKWPWIRSLGLSEKYCIAAEELPEIQSRYRITLQKTPVLTNANNHGMWEYVFQLKDSERNTAIGEVVTYINTDYGNRNIMCNKQADFKQFRSSVTQKSDPRYVAIKSTNVDDPVDFPGEVAATAAQLDKFHWSGSVQKKYASNIVSEDGNTWVETKYIKTDTRGSFSLDGYYLASLQGGVLVKTLIKSRGKNAQDITGISTARDRIAVIVLNRSSQEQRILEYSKDGVPQRALSLTTEQLGDLKDK